MVFDLPKGTKSPVRSRWQIPRQRYEVFGNYCGVTSQSDSGWSALFTSQRRLRGPGDIHQYEEHELPLCHVLTSKWVWVYFLLIPWCHNTGMKYTSVEFKHRTRQNSRTKEVLALPEIENDIPEPRCRWKQPVRRGDATQGRVSGHALKTIRRVTCW